jgi:competence protein ComEC
MLEHPRRHPAVPIAVCFAAGILLDACAPAGYRIWLAAVAAGSAAWVAAFRLKWNRLAAGVLLGSVVASGGLAHHATARVLPRDHIALFASEERSLARIRGVLATAPEIYSGRTAPLVSAWRQPDASYCVLECRELDTQHEAAVAVSGRVRLRVSGRLVHARAGDQVEVLGWLTEPLPPGNPGEFDYREYLERQGLRAVVRVEGPQAVQVLGRDPEWWWATRIARARDRCLSGIERHLSERHRPVAAALMLGDRTMMTDELRESFVESGLLHVLAISGMHVAILALFVWCACRLLNLSPGATSLAALLVVVSYACLAHSRPPVVRATVVVVLVTAGAPWHRRPGSANLLALAALVVLAWRPADLFDSGTQLSFLSVAGILAWHHLWGRHIADARQASALVENPPRWRRGAGLAWRWLKTSWGLSTCIWLLTLPLIAAQFHVVSAVGLALNVLLGPLVIALLWAGYLFVGVALFAPVLAAPFGWAFDRLLGLFLGSVDLAARIDLGHRYVEGPAVWWLIGFYVLAAAVMWLAWRWQGRRAAFGAVSAWLVVGLAAGLAPARPPGLRCTFLSVGHGCAVLLEFPGGKTLLYDAGALDNSRRAARIVQECLWERGRERLDAIVVSHADLDHFNAVPELLETLPVGCVLAAPSFLKVRQRDVGTVCDTLWQAGVPLRLIGRDDRLRLDPDARVSVLQPASDERFSTDNANSIVLLIEYAGRRILLPGDLEDDGLERLLAEPPRDLDVLLAPHHGSLRANPVALADWAQAEHVIVSRGRFDGLQRLAEIYGERTNLYATAEDGAITCRVSPAGRLSCETFR